MAKLIWDDYAERYFQTGVSHGVLYLKNADQTYDAGIVWNGLINVTEKHTGGDEIRVYANDAPFTDIYELETVEATIEAYTYPIEFEQCDGYEKVNEGIFVGTQDRRHFGLCYRTVIGTPTDPNYGYKIHVLYDCVAKPSERVAATINDSPDIATFSWDVYSYQQEVSGYKPTSSLIIDSTKTKPIIMERIEQRLYGSSLLNAELPTLDELLDILESHYLITENFDIILFGTTRIFV